ncbi:hypothetical protein PHYSODRAFT_253899 [Phytophthora sojae]|uniref:Guanylate-binding protein N-terminal domain-containing protein n=1 Tax=Phytophthora sojae (strain P6497) TaxID=1094619 RepID=G5AAT1_PHYSP|nr:hypothetical protein PHYSODRAFT_253899 [Phytophthora sojae]EGZ07710.1 hypothetical protein PHYSODRAFT_253899 [Phytophthora sojae]|eukprot:XP_009537276.1 hypothetical protein PHYSODRAFT_253899 [Phytophthora sojae]
MLKLLHNGEDMASSSRAETPSESSDSGGTEASEIAQSIRFGLLSPLLESWSGRCAVVTSMGNQSTGKSYFLNHLTGTSFAISGSRCTDGAWMSLRFVSANILLVVLDFEGLGSFERSEQEDIFLSVLNASVSLFTVFRMESRFDKDLDNLFSRFQKGVQLIKNDPRLFRGLLYMSVKDVNLNDRRGVYSELKAKMNAIFKSSREHFLMEMYAGSLQINCAPPFGTIEYYQSMEKDSAATLLKIVAPFGKEAGGFVTAWTTDASQKLPGILRTGCHVSQSLVTDPTIPDHLKEDVLRVGAREKVVILAKEVFQAYPSFVPKWTPLNDAVALDGIKDSEFDLGVDVTALDGRKGRQIQKMMNALFRQLQGAEYGKSRLTTEHQSSFDAFVAFVLRRRKMKVASWLRSHGAEDGGSVAHMCLGSHGCPAMCMVDGVCEQKVRLKKSARTCTGARGSFQYIFQEMNGCKKQCAQVLASGTRDHEGVQHSCIAPVSDRTQSHGSSSSSGNAGKHFGHMGLHVTSHGNMKQTYFLAKGNDIDVEERKYQVGERGIAEMMRRAFGVRRFKWTGYWKMAMACAALTTSDR